MMGGPGPGPGYMTKPNYMSGPVQPSPIYTVDNQLRWAHHLDNNGQNIYAVNKSQQSKVLHLMPL